MAEPIRSFPQQPPEHFVPKAAPNVPALSKQMCEQVLTLADQLQKILEDPTLVKQQSFLDTFASNAARLHQTVHEALLVR